MQKIYGRSFSETTVAEVINESDENLIVDWKNFTFYFLKDDNQRKI